MHARRRILGSRSIGERGATGEEYGPLDWRLQQKIGEVCGLSTIHMRETNNILNFNFFSSLQVAELPSATTWATLMEHHCAADASAGRREVYGAERRKEMSLAWSAEFALRTGHPRAARRRRLSWPIPQVATVEGDRSGSTSGTVQVGRGSGQVRLRQAGPHRVSAPAMAKGRVRAARLGHGSSFREMVSGFRCGPHNTESEHGAG